MFVAYCMLPVSTNHRFYDIFTMSLSQLCVATKDTTLFHPSASHLIHLLQVLPWIDQLDVPHLGRLCQSLSIRHRCAIVPNVGGDLLCVSHEESCKLPATTHQGLSSANCMTLSLLSCVQQCWHKDAALVPNEGSACSSRLALFEKRRNRE